MEEACISTRGNRKCLEIKKKKLKKDKNQASSGGGSCSAWGVGRVKQRPVLGNGHMGGRHWQQKSFRQREELLP